MLDHLVGLIDRVLNSQVTGTKPVQDQIPDDGPPVYELTYIMEWLEYRYPEPLMLPAEPEAVMEAKLVQVIAEGVMDATVQLFWEMQRDHISTA
jgi:glutathione S-transferase